MGCCGGSSTSYPEIDDAKSIEELFNHVNTKLTQCEDEIQKTSDYIDDHDKVPKEYNVVGYSDDDLKKRVIFLQDYVKALQHASDVMKEHSTEMDLNQTKTQLHSLYDCYPLFEDTENYLGQISDNINILAGIGN